MSAKEGEREMHLRRVDDEVYLAFRIQAIKEKRTLADLFEHVAKTYLRRVGAWKGK